MCLGQTTKRYNQIIISKIILETDMSSTTVAFLSTFLPFFLSVSPCSTLWLALSIFMSHASIKSFSYLFQPCHKFMLTLLQTLGGLWQSSLACRLTSLPLHPTLLQQTRSRCFAASSVSTASHMQLLFENVYHSPQNSVGICPVCLIRFKLLPSECTTSFWVLNALLSDPPQSLCSFFLAV